MVREKNRAMLQLLEGIEADLERRGMSPRVWQHWPLEWAELLYDLGAHDSRLRNNRTLGRPRSCTQVAARGRGHPG
jgi:hypothetical protein